MTLTPRERAKKSVEAQALDPAVHVGKDGVTEALVAELGRQLKARRLVKVRLLPSARGDAPARGQAEQLAAATSSELVEVRGATAVLYRA